MRAQSQQPAVSVAAKAGYGGTGAYLIGEWLPIRVTLNNPSGGRSMHVRVQVAAKGPDDSVTAGIYAREVDLPTPSRKEITLYTFSGNFTRRFHVQVLDGSSTVAVADVDADPYEPPANMVIGVASSDPSLLNVLKSESIGHVVNSLPYGGYPVYGGFPPQSSQPNSTHGAATVAHINLADIPTLSEALNSLGAIVLDDVDTGTLSDDQRASLEAWVSRGGTLVAAIRPGGAEVTAGIAGLLPVTVAGSRNVSSLDSLRDFISSSASLAGQDTIGAATLRPELAAVSRVLAQQDGTPLLVERDLGLGHVIYMGTSPGVAPLKNWDGTLPLVKKLLAEHTLRLSYGDFVRFGAYNNYYSGSLFPSYGGLFAIPALALPDPLILGFFLLVYIIIVGPLNFIVLRRIRRTELAWLTVPAFVLIFSVIAYLLAFQSKGGDLVAIRANAINTYTGSDQAIVDQHFGLFSPVRRTYNLSLPADSVVTEMNSFGSYPTGDAASPVIGGNPTTISNVNINTWSLKAYLAEHIAKAQSPLETHLNLGDNIIAGTVRNRTNAPLQDVALIRGSAVTHIGYVAPGQSVDVRLGVSAGRFDNSTPTSVLPPPAGVSPVQGGPSFLPYGGQTGSAAQRTYNRKVELLSAALYPLLADTPPMDMNLIVVAWGAALPTNFDVQDYGTSTEELNVWTDLAAIGTSSNEKPGLTSGSVPYSVFAPANTPNLVTWNGTLSLTSGQGVPGSPPTAVPTLAPPVGVTPTPAASNAVVQQPQTINIFPYADVLYKLPAGIKPDKLTLAYSVRQLFTDGDIDILAHNVGGGTWDRIATIPKPVTIQAAPFDATYLIPNPAAYTDAAGNVAIRLKPTGTQATMSQTTLDMALNAK